MPNWKPPTADPSEAEIREACREIRSRWSDAEHERRSHHPASSVVTEIVPASALYGESDRGG